MRKIEGYWGGSKTPSWYIEQCEIQEFLQRELGSVAKEGPQSIFGVQAMNDNFKAIATAVGVQGTMADCIRIVLAKQVAVRNLLVYRFSTENVPSLTATAIIAV